MSVKILAAILSITVLFSCNTKNNEEPALEIGQYKLTAPELEAKRKNEKYRFLTDQAFNDKLIEEGRILAFALDQGYDTVSALKKLLEYASRSYATSPDGFVWGKKIASRRELTEKDLREAYQKRSQELILDVILIRNKSVLDKYFSPGKDFNFLKNSVSSVRDAKVFTVPSRFPYSPLSIYISDVGNAKKGDVLGPVNTEDGYLVARVADIKPLSQNPYEQEKESIKREMVSMSEKKDMWDNQQQIFNKADLEINDSAIRELTSKFNTREKSWPGVDHNLVVMNYTLGDKRITYHVSDFDEFVKNEPVFLGSLSNPDDVKNMLRSFVTERYLFAEAQQMNIQADGEYQRFRKNYKEKLLIEHYKRNYIYPKISVQPKESEDYYRKNSNNFKAFESASVIVYRFDSRRDAFRGGRVLMSKISGSPNPRINAQNTNRLPLPEAHYSEVKLTDQNHSPEFIKALLKLKPGQISSPVEVNGEFLIIVLSSKRGLITLPYNYVKNEIDQLLKSQKELQISNQLTEGLKEKYPAKTNKIQDYLSGV